MRKAFNKYGNIEIEENILKYRITAQELGMDDPEQLVKEIKRKIQSVNSSENYLLPFDVTLMNRYMVLYYELSHFHSIDYLRELDLEEKLPFYLSLIDIAKEEEKGQRVSWDRFNFFCDKYEKNVKVALFETESLKIYEDTPDLLKTVKDLICTTMTVLPRIVTLPKRQDFINPSEENIQFIENVYRMKTLDDLYMFIETLSLDLEEENTVSIEREEEPKKRTRLFKPSEKKPVMKVEKKKVQKTKKNPNNSGNKKTAQQKKDQQMKRIIIGVGVAVVLYLFSPYLTPSSETSSTDEVVSLVSTDETGYFKGTANNDVNLVDAYRKAYNSEYEDAFGSLSKVKKTELDLKDVPLLIQVYDETGNLAPLLDEVPNLANDVVTYLLTKNKLDKLPTIAAGMETKNPYIEFENAHIKQDYEYMLTLIDDVDINGRKESQIMDGYLALEKYDEARKFAEKVGNPDLIKLVEESTS